MNANVRVGIKGPWVGIAFLEGDITKFRDDLVMGATFGRMTHCEFMIGNGNIARSYGAFTDKGFVESNSQICGDRWHVTCFPVKDHSLTYPFILRALSLNIQYNKKDLWQCCVKTMLPYETELDCNTPETWSTTGVFCSQVCLLFLRKFNRDKVITCPAKLTTLIENTHSRGCSPNTLFYALNGFSQKN